MNTIALIIAVNDRLFAPQWTYICKPNELAIMRLWVVLRFVAMMVFPYNTARGAAPAGQFSRGQLHLCTLSIRGFRNDREISSKKVFHILSFKNPIFI
ncbi:hypothetical protein ANAPC1_00825 [Anaplasma phagocytophilum]|uniref:Uncharacterized protein n=1 Tax=Anaplasma phagocytophilum TaxID=948 RepID=A0AA45UT79_ANAPH|nr:hypothetical protein ANAPC1_00825 [Anaplasma phagocytophilum]